MVLVPIKQFLPPGVDLTTLFLRVMGVYWVERWDGKTSFEHFSGLHSLLFTILPKVGDFGAGSVRRTYFGLVAFML